MVAGIAPEMSERDDFESVAMPLLDTLYRTARVLAGSDADARDLVQTTYLKALQRFGSFRPGTSAKAWMMTILRNTWIDVLRRRQTAGHEVPLDEERLAAPPDGPAEEEAAMPADVLEQFSDAEVIAALLELPERQRAALFLSDVEGLDQDEVAEALDVPVGTVKSRLSRARAVLGQRLRDHARRMGFLGRRPCRT
jgi:RNA polymerase sigma-70 factor (ECF subfamily)